MAAPRIACDMGGAVVALAPVRSGPSPGQRQLTSLARSLAPLGDPVVVYSASHSGSRLLAMLLQRCGVFLGANRNDSEDSLDLFELTRFLVEAHAPDFAALFADGDASLPERALSAFRAHLSGRPPAARWGWKLPETTHVLPVIAQLFPCARVIHLLRDGRDVAFCPFVAPKAPFWRKIYFGDAEIRRWRGLAMTQRAYRAHGHRFNAARWAHSVKLGRAHGLLLAERYLEVRYEALVGDPQAQMRRIVDFLGLETPWSASSDVVISRRSVGKWRQRPRREVAEVLEVLGPTLAQFGYGEDGAKSPPGVAPLVRAPDWGRGVSAETHAKPGGLGGLFRVRAQR